MSDLINHKDPQYFRQLYNDYYKALVLYGMKFLEDDQAASEDIVQEVFSIVWNKDLFFDNETQLKVYLYNSVRNNCLDYMKHRNVEMAYINKVLKDNPRFCIDSQQQEEVFSEEIYRKLFEVIGRLSPRQREIFLMMMEGKHNREIAETLGISIETVKTQKKRAKNYLKEHLDKEIWMLLSIFLSNIH